MSSDHTLWFPKRWAPKHPERIQLYSMATPNGQKIGIALEEMNLDYEAHLIDITQGDQDDPQYRQINPNGKIPSLIDPNNQAGQVTLMESGAILEYLATMTNRYFGHTPLERLAIKQWLYFQMAHVGPMFGQFGHFYKYARDKCDHPYPLERYTGETQRLLDVLDTQLRRHAYIACEDYSIADMAVWPWVDCLDNFYHAQDHLELPRFEYVQMWREKIANHPAVQRGRNVCQLP